MKSKIKSLLISILTSILLGIILGKYIYKIYNNNIENTLTSSKLYLLENGEYNTYEDMRLDNNYNNYIYYEDNNKYKSIIGITTSKDNINKIKEVYSNNIKVTEYFIEESLLNDKQEEYDKEILNTEDYKYIKEILNNIINLYKTDTNIKLISN